MAACRSGLQAAKRRASGVSRLAALSETCVSPENGRSASDPDLAVQSISMASRNRPFRECGTVPFLHLRYSISGKRNREQVLGNQSLHPGVCAHRHRPSRNMFPIGNSPRYRGGMVWCAMKLGAEWSSCGAASSSTIAPLWRSTRKCPSRLEQASWPGRQGRVA